nr:MAG TPA: BppU domain protein [Caudoviricetes sp.]
MENYQIQQEINIDFATPDVPPRVYAKQYDNNMRIIKANLYANGQPYTVQSGFDVNVRMAKPDGTYVYNPALEASGTYALIVLTQQMLAVAGECPAEIEVTQGSNVLSTATFVICVAADPVPENSIESTDEFKTIQEILEEVEAASKIVTDNLDAINAVSENIEAIKNAPQQAQNAANSATLAQSWAVGGTGTREGEDTDNAKYYAQIAQQVAQGGVGYYETPEALRTAHPTGQAGNWAIVGSTDTIWVWDTDTNDWVDSHGNIDMSNYYTKTEADARFSAMSSGVPTVSATKEQNYFDIDLPSTNQFVIVPNAAYATGDTFRIAGRAVEAMLPNGDSLPDAFFAANAKVMCLWADTILYFVGGGTVPNNVMRYRMDDGTPGQQPEQTIWGQTSDGQDAYVHSCTKAVYDSESEKTLDVLLREMLLAELPQPGQWNFAPYRISYGEGGVNAKRHPWVNFDDDLDKTVYAALYAAIGDTMSDGAADGMFNCKKLAERFPLVCGANFSVPVAGGEKEHTLTVEELPEHKHVMPYTTGSGASAGVGYKLGTSETQSWSATLTTGAGKAHNNMPPYIVQTVHVKS